MKYCILIGSPRKAGNTASLLGPFIDELKKAGAEVSCIWLYDKKIEPCIACRTCQNEWSKFGCVKYLTLCMTVTSLYLLRQYIRGIVLLP